MPDLQPPRISFFVSSHGFGHAARASAVMQALRVRRPDCRLRVYTETPEWSFGESVGALDYRVLRTDIGLVQHSPLVEDIPATLEQLATFMPFASGLEDTLAAELAGQNLVVCDISPLGLRAAATAGVPAVLLENFTWDWIYRAYLDEHPGLAPYVDYLEAINAGVDLHIQTEPVCQPRPGTTITVGPIARQLRGTRSAVRERLEVESEVPLVLVSMGGVPAQYPFLERLRGRRDAVYLIPGAAAERRRDGALLALPPGPTSTTRIW